MGFKGSYQSYDSKTMASVAATYLPISAKDSREIAKAIKGKRIGAAITYLQAVIDRKQAVPFKRFNRDTPHRRGKIAAGRFPRKASEHILKLLKNLKANAADKNLDDENLLLVHVSAQRGPVLWHYGRKRGRQRKCTHFEAVAKEIKAEKKKEDLKKEIERPRELKAEVKKVEKTAEKTEKKIEVKKKEPKKEIKIEKKSAEVVPTAAELKNKKEEAKKK